MYVCFLPRYALVHSAVSRIVHSAVLPSHVVRPSVCLSVCDVRGSGPHRLEILELFQVCQFLRSFLFSFQTAEWSEKLVCSFELHVSDVNVNIVPVWLRDGRCEVISCRRVNMLMKEDFLTGKVELNTCSGDDRPGQVWHYTWRHRLMTDGCARNEKLPFFGSSVTIWRWTYTSVTTGVAWLRN